MANRSTYRELQERIGANNTISGQTRITLAAKANPAVPYEEAVGPFQMLLPAF